MSVEVITPDPAAIQPKPLDCNALRRLCQGLVSLAGLELAVQVIRWLTPLAFHGGGGTPWWVESPDEALPFMVVPRILFPLALAVLIWRRPRPGLIAAAMTTAGAFLLDRALALVRLGFLILDQDATGWGTASGQSFASVPPQVVIQVVLHVLGFGISALLLNLTLAYGRAGRRARKDAHRHWRQNAGDRAIVLVALAFGVASTFSQGWSIYVDLLERVPPLRSWVLGPSRYRVNRSRPLTAEERQARDASRGYNEGDRLAAEGKYAEAAREYMRSLLLYRELSRSTARGRTDYSTSVGLVANNFSWMLATARDEASRDGVQSVELGYEAVRAVPDDGNYWNTLAVAQFRAGQLPESRASFDESMSRRGGGDGYDWYFLAMIAHREGRTDEAKSWYDRATALLPQAAPGSLAELSRFQAEAAREIGLPAPTPAIADSATGASSPAPRVFMFRKGGSRFVEPIVPISPPPTPSANPANNAPAAGETSAAGPGS
jgi:tetratricopeptide (TPR) repeat protein